jgi:hypothetical protein
MVHRGHCLCGASRFTCAEPVKWVLHCHCESCRRATASPMTTFVSVPDAQVAWSGLPPSTYASSPGVSRGFCPTCGSPLFFRSDSLPGETHLYVALLDDPGALVPEGHDFLEERIDWMNPIPDTRTPHA